MKVDWKKQSRNPFLYVCVGLVIVFLVYRVGIPYAGHPNSFGKSDFTVFYSAAEVLTDGGNPYAQKQIKPVIRQHRPYIAGFRYLYPPTAALVFMPLLILKFQAAVFAWLALTILALYGIAYLVQFVIDRRFTWQDWSLITGLFIVFGPIYTNLRLGQINIILAFVCLAMIVASRKKKYWLAGAALAALALIKVFPVALIVYFILKKQWRIVMAAVVSSVVILGISVGIFGWQPHLDYIKTLRTVAVEGIGEQNDIVSYDNATLNGTLQRVITFNHASNQLTAGEEKTVAIIRGLAILLVGILLVGLTWWQRVRPVSVTEVSLWVLSIFLLSTEIHAQYFVWLLPLFVVYLVSYNKPVNDVVPTQVPRWQWIVLVVVFLLYSFSSLKRFGFILEKWYFGLVALSFIASVILFGWLVHRMWVDRCQRVTGQGE